MATFYHIVSNQDFLAFADGEFYCPPSLDKEGFVHFSTDEQWPKTLKRFYKGVSDLWLLAIDSSKLDQEVVFEDLYDHGDDFPHYYGKVPLSAIVSKRKLDHD